MKFDLKEMYSYLLSHTFPGMLLLIEILLFLRNTTYPGIFDVLLKNTAILILAGYAFSTLLGTMLDGIQHFIFDFFIDMKGCYKNWGAVRKENKEDATKKFKAINKDKMDIYKHFVEDDLWYPYEAYANISVAMLLGLILLPTIKLPGQFWLVYGIILILLCFEAWYTFYVWYDEENAFVEVYSQEKK